MSHVTTPDASESAPIAHYVRHATSVFSANGEALWKYLRYIVFAILLTRSACDPIFNQLDFGASTMGFGALVNALAIAVAFGLLLQRPTTSLFPVFAMWGPFLLITFASTLYAPDFPRAARLALVLLSYWAFFIMPFFLLRSRADLSSFMLWILASSIAPSLYAFWDIRNGLSDMADFRLQSTFSHPNIFAFYLVLMLSLALYVLNSSAIRLKSELRTLITYYVPLLIVFLALTKTRSAWVACGLVFMVYAIRIDRRFFATLLIVPLLLVVDSSLMDRLTNLTQGPTIEDFSQLNADTRLNSYAWREALWESAMPAIAAQPLFGHGLETFKPSTPEFFPLIGPDGIDAHNFYLQVTFEMGLLGLLALLWLFGTLVVRVAGGYGYDPKGTVIMMSTLIAYLLESYSDNMHFYLSFNWYFWFVLGAVCAWISRERKYRAEEALRSS